VRVLLIEPDKLQARLYQAALEQAGHTVEHAQTAQSAVHAADVRKPDVVVLELQLANHNGVEFLYEFRSYAEWAAVPVIVHSFVPPAELAHTSTLTAELGVVRVLHKPETTLAGLCAAVQALTPARL
jgi:two-component system KDP operon response regulator KdpE